MKKVFYCLIILILTTFSSCDKILPDLPRDNKADSAYVGNDSERFRKLQYYSSSVICRYPKGAVTYYEDNIIQAGDRTFLSVIVKNICNNTIEQIRATFTCDKSFIHLVQPQSNFFVRFIHDVTIDNIPSWSTGYSQITDGKYFHAAPNYNFYAVEFTVDSNVTQNSSFTLTMNLTDRFNNNWVQTIDLTVK